MKFKFWLTFACSMAIAGCGSESTTKKKDGASDMENGGASGGAGSPGTAGSTGKAGNTGNNPTGGSGGGTAMGGNGGGGNAMGGNGGGNAMGGNGGGNARDAGSDARPSDGGGMAGSGGTPGKVTCGTMKADVSKIKNGAEGMVIGPDGTIYYGWSFGMYIGRFKPPYDAPEPMWAKMPDGNAQLLGVILDPKRKVVYGGARGSMKMYRVQMDDPTKVDVLGPVENGVNGVTLGEDEAVYYTDQTGGNVYRITPDGMKSKVTAMTLPDLNGIAFGPDGQLYVLQYGMGLMWRLKLANGMEVSREMFATVGGKNADGIAFDKMGRVYVTASGLHMISADGKMSTPIPGFASGANIDFGAGALGCNDLYGVAGWARKDMLDSPGMDVPWHRAP